MFSDADRKVNHKLCNSIHIGYTRNMEVTTKVISLVLMFSLSTEANHGGEYILHCSIFMRAKCLPSTVVTMQLKFPPQESQHFNQNYSAGTASASI